MILKSPNRTTRIYHFRDVSLSFKREIYRKPDELYLTRYYLIRTPWLGVYIHKFHLSDYPVPHDHPWDFITCPLTVGYKEHDKDGKVTIRKPFRFAYRKAERFHWVEMFNGKPMWTLFIRFKLRRSWGFLTKDQGWVSEKVYNRLIKNKLV